MKGLYNMSERSSESVDDVEPTHIAATETLFPEKKLVGGQGPQ